MKMKSYLLVLVGLIAGSILAQTVCLADSVVPHTLAYEIVTNVVESPIQFVVSRDQAEWEVHFRKGRKQVKLEAVSVLHADRSIAKVSDPHETLFSIQKQMFGVHKINQKALLDETDHLSLDFHISFTKALPKDHALYLSFQIRKSLTETVCYLVRIDGTLNKSDAGDRTAPTAIPEFTAAIKNGNVTRVIQLLDGNPEQVNLPLGESGWTPLQRATRYGHQELVVELIEQGAKVNLQDNYGWTALHYAALNGREDVVTYLLKNGADINRQAHQGETPLHWAVNNNQSSAAMLLVNCGAHLSPLDRLGRTPLDIAIKMGHSSLQKSLQDSGCLTSKKLAKTYDWTAPQKTVRKLQTFQSEVSKTFEQDKDTLAPNKPDAGDGL